MKEGTKSATRLDVFFCYSDLFFLQTNTKAKMYKTNDVNQVIDADYTVIIRDTPTCLLGHDDD